MLVWAHNVLFICACQIVSLLVLSLSSEIQCAVIFYLPVLIVSFTLFCIYCLYFT